MTSSTSNPCLLDLGGDPPASRRVQADATVSAVDVVALATPQRRRAQERRRCARRCARQLWRCARRRASIGATTDGPVRRSSTNGLWVEKMNTPSGARTRRTSPRQCSTGLVVGQAVDPVEARRSTTSNDSSPAMDVEIGGITPDERHVGKRRPAGRDHRVGEVDADVAATLSARGVRSSVRRRRRGRGSGGQGRCGGRTGTARTPSASSVPRTRRRSRFGRTPTRPAIVVRTAPSSRSSTISRRPGHDHDGETRRRGSRRCGSVELAVAVGGRADVQPRSTRARDAGQPRDADAPAGPVRGDRRRRREHRRHGRRARRLVGDAIRAYPSASSGDRTAVSTPPATAVCAPLAARVIVFLDDDERAPPDHLERIVAVLDGEPDLPGRRRPGGRGREPTPPDL